MLLVDQNGDAGPQPLLHAMALQLLERMVLSLGFVG